MFDSKRVDKEVASSKSSSVADLSKLVNASTIQLKISFSIELSFARFEFVSSKAFDTKQVDKEAASSKLSSVDDLSNLVN